MCARQSLDTFGAFEIGSSGSEGAASRTGRTSRSGGVGELGDAELFGGRRGGPLPAHDGRSDGRHGQKRADSTRLRHSPWMPAVDVATATSRRVLRAGSRNVHSNSKVPPTAQLCTAVSKNKKSWKFRLGASAPPTTVFIVYAAALAGNVHASSLTTHLATHRRIRARPAVRSCTPARGPPRTPGAPSPSSTIRQTWATAGGSARGQPP